MQEMIQYPTNEATREAAEARQPDTVHIECAGPCKHRVGFQSVSERSRFLNTSGWSGTIDALVCPVCKERARSN